jgi:hypothetical protein
MDQTSTEAQDLHPLELADRIDPGDEGSKCVLTIDLTHAADLIRRMHSAGIEQEREIIRKGNRISGLETTRQALVNATAAKGAHLTLLEAQIATMAGQAAAIGHLSALVDEQRAILVEIEHMWGFDEWGDKLHEGECRLMDRIRTHLATVAAPQTS